MAALGWSGARRGALIFRGRFRSAVQQSASRICGRARRSITLAGRLQQEIGQPWRLIVAEQTA
jgi:hypothetical protein